MSERGICPVCQGQHALAKDGTPYKHNHPTSGEVCEGGDQQAFPLLAWHVYGSEITVDQIKQFPVVVVGPNNQTEPVTEIDYTAKQTLAYIGSYDHQPTPDDFMLIVPQEYASNAPPGPGVEDAPTDVVPPAEDASTS